MALPVDQSSISSSENNNKSYLFPLALVTSLFFLWGLANSLNGTLVKQFQIALDLQRWQANIVETAFYFGYFAMALPAGMVMRKFGYKMGILFGLGLYALGAFLFYPAADMRTYGFFLFALFLIASGIAFLETASNLYVTILGDAKSGDFRLNLAQSFNGLSAILGPIIGSMFIFSNKEYTKEQLAQMPTEQVEVIRNQAAQSVQHPYLMIGLIVSFIALLFMLTKLPEVKFSSAGNSEKLSIGQLLKIKHLRMGILAQFLNIGAQISLWGNFVDFKLDLARKSNLGIVEKLYQITSDMSDVQIASYHASFAFILFMAGRFIGTYFMGKHASNKVLTIYALGAVASMVICIFGSGIWAVVALMMVYFFQSIMFPTIFALSCKNLGDNSKLASSLLIMSIVGGSIIPPITAFLFKIGPSIALIVPLICFVYIVYFAAKGYKIEQTA